jgi:hypothetical protein
MDWQRALAIGIAVLAAIWAGWLFLGPLLSAMKPKKPGDCGGGCGCGKMPSNKSRKP